MKTIDQKYFDNPDQYIPQGMYCHNFEGENICPFWDIDEAKTEQENGYCHLFKIGDWNINSQDGKIIDIKTENFIHLEYYPFGGMLWEQCKCKQCEDTFGNIFDLVQPLAGLLPREEFKKKWGG
jgi:hypothetical protein